MSTPKKREALTPGRWFERGPLGSLRQEMDDLFENFFGETGLLKPATDLVPSVDLSETEGEVQVVTDLPGFKPEEVNIEINDNYLTISGTHTEETREEGNGRKFHRIERRSGHFSRSIALPCPVKEDQVDARLKDGVLAISLPKAEEAKTKKIAIKE